MWKSMGKPRCWCYARQCKGDADGGSTGTTKTGISFVGNPDLQVFLKAYNVLEPPKGPGVQGEPNICADFAHSTDGTTKTGLIRVGNPDLQIFLKSYNFLEPPKGSGVPTCPGTYTLPTDFKPCN